MAKAWVNVSAVGVDGMNLSEIGLKAADVTCRKVLVVGASGRELFETLEAAGAEEVVHVANVLPGEAQASDPDTVNFGTADHSDEGHEGFAGIAPGGFDLLVFQGELDARRRPADLFRRFHRVLAPNGTLIAIFPVTHSRYAEWSLVYSESSQGEEMFAWRPSIPLFHQLATGFAERNIRTFHDGRSVWRLSKSRPTVTLVYGESGAGKTLRARMETDGGAILISVDKVLSSFDRLLTDETRVNSDALLGQLRRFLAGLEGSRRNAGLLGNQDKLAKHIAEANQCEELLDLLVAVIDESEQRYVIEGGILLNEKVRSWISTKLRAANAKVWHLGVDAEDR